MSGPPEDDDGETPCDALDGVESVEFPLEAELDLHTFSPRDVPSVVEEYVHACRERGISPVRIVHGRGKGVQRAVVQRVLRSLSGVVAIREALPGAGGWGATIVELAPLQTRNDR